MTDDILSVFIRGHESAAVGEFNSVKLQLSIGEDSSWEQGRQGSLGRGDSLFAGFMHL